MTWWRTASRPSFRRCRAWAWWPQLAQNGHVTGASTRNWSSYGGTVELPEGLPDWQRNLLVDPQTSGGLLISCAADKATAILETIQRAGYASARVVGHTEAGPPRVRVTM